MVKITFEIKDDLNQRFRKLIVQNKGLYRGAIQDTIIEAINLWMKNNRSGKQLITKKKNIQSKNIKQTIQNLNELDT